MKFFIDTADVKEIRAACQMGCIDGVTTNPSLLARVGRSLEETIREICTLINGPVSAEAMSEAKEALTSEGRRLAAIHPNVVVKIPMTVEGMKAVKQLKSEGISTNVTLCFSPTQALLAAKAGATFISPFVGRLDDVSQEGMALVRDILTIYRHYSCTTQVLVASIRHPIHVLEAARMGAHVVTMPYSVLLRLAQHPLTDAGIQTFLTDWQKVPQP